MEVEVKRVVTGNDLLAELLAKYGTRGGLARAARGKGAFEARDDLATVELLEESPKRRHAVWSETSLRELPAAEFDRLTRERLRLLEHLYSSSAEENVTQLAHSLGRDKKNVSEDLQTLRRMGLVGMRRTGREAIPVARGNEIHIRLGRPPRRPGASARQKRKRRRVRRARSPTA